MLFKLTSNLSSAYSTQWLFFGELGEHFRAIACLERQNGLVSWGEIENLKKNFKYGHTYTDTFDNSEDNIVFLRWNNDVVSDVFAQDEQYQWNNH